MMDTSPNLFPYYMLENGIALSECKETAKILGFGWAGDGESGAEALANALVTHGPYGLLACGDKTLRTSSS
jgi:hypothetical protein